MESANAREPRGGESSDAWNGRPALGDEETVAYDDEKRLSDDTKRRLHAHELFEERLERDEFEERLKKITPLKP